MPEVVLQTRLPRGEVERRIAAVALALTGEGTDPTGQVEQLQVAVAMTALGFIRDAFITKSQGGTDEAGDSWPALSKRYVAYGRTHPGLARQRGRAAKRGQSSRPLLTPKQNERWKKIYGQMLRRSGPFPTADAKGRAAAYAWAVLKAEGARTILGVYGDTKVDTLRDTGLLLTSLSPGESSSEQILRTEPGQVIVGTNREGAEKHHLGIGVPQRKLWPDQANWPAKWSMAMMVTMRDALIKMIRQQMG